MIEPPQTPKQHPTVRRTVIPFPAARRQRRWIMVGTIPPVVFGGLDAGWHLVQAAPVWWWQGILALLWCSLLGIVATIYHALWTAGGHVRPSPRRDRHGSPRAPRPPS